MKKFEIPVIEIIEFQCADVITASGTEEPVMMNTLDRG